VKGLGGFQLVVDARDASAVERLRARKRRPDKPFALMFPDLDAVRARCEADALETALLCSAQAPIVLLRKQRHAAGIAPAIAPGSPELGAMLPYTPLHHLLVRELGFPVVATSGNLSEEPIAVDECEALERLGAVADLFLVHDRPIARPVEDSVVRVVLGRELVLRRARGYAPYPLPVPAGGTAPVLLATGAHLKSTVSLLVAGGVVTSAHVGDLDSPEARSAYARAAKDLVALHEAEPAAIACDLHPDYFSTRFAEDSGLPRVPVQHHVAHVAACMAENGLPGPVLGVAWDGTGDGGDGTVWGGEFLLVEAPGHVRRFAHLAHFRLPGGERAVREPRRAALGALHAAGLPWTADLAPVAGFADGERRVLGSMLERGVQAPLTSSAGRLFDAVASLLGLRQVTGFEGQAAMALEWVCDEAAANLPDYSIALEGDAPIRLDWHPMLEAILRDLRRGAPAGAIAAAFHRALAEAIARVARRAGIRQVALTGGCFQNRFLLECSVEALRTAGLEPFWHRQVPPNDGGISIGQAAWAAATMAGR
jgi:hydrogenase maturation protein HypF